MEVKTWEDYISLNTSVQYQFDVLKPANSHLTDDELLEQWKESCEDINNALSADASPLPSTDDREGYYGNKHFDFWASGLRDYSNLIKCANRLNNSMETYLDFGCATGRVIRHPAALKPDRKVYGCDINKKHVDWCNKYLTSNACVFQNHSIPSLPLADNSIDFISAFSVFTHIEAFETTWLMEIRRVLKKGGIAWLTLHSEETFQEVEEGWPLYKALDKHPDFQQYKDNRIMDDDRLIFRWHQNKSYSANVFYKKNYIENVWGRIIPLVEFHRRLPLYQDVAVFQK